MEGYAYGQAMVEARRDQVRSGLASGIVQSLIAAALGSGVLPVLKFGWQRFFHRPLWESVQSPLANVVAAVVLVPPFWFLTKFASRWVEVHSLGKTPPAKGNRLSIYVAHFGNDEMSVAARERVVASIRNELGPDRVEVLPAGIQLSLTPDVSYDFATEKAMVKARSLLRKKHGDLLIWGKVYAMQEMRPQIELRFVSAENEQSRVEPFGFTEKLMLDSDFGSEMGSALAAVVTASATPAISYTEYEGRYVADILAPVALKLEPLIRRAPLTIRGLDRANLYLSYGLIQTRIGEQSGQTQPLEKAVAAYREALKEFTRERMPMHWAGIQNNLGNVLRILGERENRAEKLEQAVAACQEALQERTRERVPFEWAMTQNNLGVALGRLGEVEDEPKRFDGAVMAFRSALKEYPREWMPLQWASTQNNLGNALVGLGERESTPQRLRDAIAAFHEALKESTRERAPLLWATTQNNLGIALEKLGKLEGRTENLHKAIAAYREALKEYPRERMPLDWATTKMNMGVALGRLGALEEAPKELEEAVMTVREVLKECTRERAPRTWAAAQNNLGCVLTFLGDWESGTESLDEAIAAYREALKEYSRERMPLQWAGVQRNIKQATELLEARKAKLE